MQTGWLVGSSRRKKVGTTMDDVAGAVLCAGLGTRLRPATEVTPKPAVPFMARPIAMHSLAALSRAGVSRFGVNVHYLPEKMRAALAPLTQAGHSLQVSEETEIQGTAGGVREIWKKVGTDKTLVVCHGDVVLGAELGEIIAAHRASGAPVTMVLKLRDGSTTLRGVFTDATGQIVRIIRSERPSIVSPMMEHAFTGIQVLEPEVFDLIPETGETCLVTEVYPRLLEADLPIASYLTTAFYADLGTYERYLQAQRAVFEEPGRLQGLEWPDEQEERVWLGSHVKVEPGATVKGPVRIEGNVRIAAGATVGPWVTINGDIEIGGDAHIEDAAIWGGGLVNESVQGTLLAM